MKKIYAAVLGGLLMVPAHGLAADLGAFPADSGSSGGSQQMVEIGTGWYIRGDVGASLDSLPTLTLNPGSLSVPPPAGITPTFGANTTKTDFVGGLGVGYKFNNYFRMDATFDYRSPNIANQSVGGIVCPYYASGMSTQTTPAVLLGYAYETDQTCNANMKITQQNYTGLLNGYYDIFTFWGVTPYVGAGAGVNVDQTTASLAYVQSSNGAPYRADLTPTGAYPHLWVTPYGAVVNPQPNIAFAPQNWDRSFKSTKTNLAIALTAGLGIALTPNATLDLSYRYLDLGSTTYTFNPQTGATASQRNTAQEVRVGIRYIPD
jgi:opacity protein-like surface antigen